MINEEKYNKKHKCKLYPDKFQETFKPDFYRVSKIVDCNVIEVDETWFVKLQGIPDDNDPEELKKWLKVDNHVRIIPYARNHEGRIISDVWIGNTHVNRQFKKYEKEVEDE